MFNDVAAEVFFPYRRIVAILEYGVADYDSGSPVAEHRAAKLLRRVVRKRTVLNRGHCIDGTGNRAALRLGRVAGKQAILHQMIHVAAVEGNRAADPVDALDNVILQNAIFKRPARVRKDHAATHADTGAEVYPVGDSETPNHIEQTAGAAGRRAGNQPNPGHRRQRSVSGVETAGAQSPVSVYKSSGQRSRAHCQEQAAATLGRVIQEVAISERRLEVLEMHGAAIAIYAVNRFVSDKTARVEVQCQYDMRIRVKGVVICLNGAAIAGRAVAAE